jgi:hypothetical protein
MLKRDDWRHEKAGAEKGNAILFVFIAIAILAMLTAAISDQSGQQTDTLDREKLIAHASKVLQHGMLMQKAVQNMVERGVALAAIDAVIPGAVGFDAAPHANKIYHPSGGGVVYLTQLGNSLTAPIVTTNATIDGVGDANATGLGNGAEILMVLSVPQGLCRQMNESLKGADVVPAFADATAFARLKSGVTNTLIDSAVCSACVNEPYRCVSNPAANDFVYYHTLYAD